MLLKIILKGRLRKLKIHYEGLQSFTKVVKKHNGSSRRLDQIRNQQKINSKDSLFIAICHIEGLYLYNRNNYDYVSIPLLILERLFIFFGVASLMI